VAHIRGSSVLSTVRFVREHFGANSHAKVLEVLPARHCGTFLGPVREASWEPVEDLVAYMETARRLLAPDDQTFFKKIGVFAGHQTRDSGFKSLLGDSPEAAFKRAAVMWRSFYDVGRLEVASQAPGEIVARIREFPDTSRALCQRITGFWEGCLHVVGTEQPHVEERICALDGGAYCEMRVTWTLPSRSEPPDAGGYR
jgi:hypothetical protein